MVPTNVSKPYLLFPLRRFLFCSLCPQRQHIIHTCLNLFFLLTIIIFIYLFIYLCLVVLGPRHCSGFPLVVARGATLWLQGAGFSLRWLLHCRAQAPGCAASAVAAHELRSFSSQGSRAQAHWLQVAGPCSVACGVFLDRGSNPCLLHWQVDSLPLSHQGSPEPCFFPFAVFIYQRAFLIFLSKELYPL